VKIDLFANDGVKDVVTFGSALAVASGTAAVKAFEVTGFEAGSTGSDVLNFTSGLLSGSTAAIATGTDKFAEIAEGGVNSTVLNSTATGIFEITGTGDVAAGKGADKAAAFA